ncbi:MAG: hypothetical protein ACD_75C00713G0001, partial [uncultured bacterium]
MSALYLHIPFCRSKCHYCSFTSSAGCSDLFVPYVAALKKELSSIATDNISPLQSIFIGGGTPTILASDLLTEILDSCHTLFPMAPVIEISVEANPGTVTEGSLRALAHAGVNRLSLGVQSFDDRDLNTLGRIHSADEACAAVRAARRAGFANLNLDLMCGLPDQSVSSWQQTLDRALALQPEHLSVYQLTVESVTSFADLLHSGRLSLPAEEDIIEMDRRTVQSCSDAGLVQYEISNYARSEFECRHNVNYWENGAYLAAGVSAVSCLDGVREKRTEGIRDYIGKMTAGLPVVVERECLSADASLRETVIMGLRMVRGVCRDSLRRRYNLDVAEYYGP